MEKKYIRVLFGLLGIVLLWMVITSIISANL